MRFVNQDYSSESSGSDIDIQGARKKLNVRKINKGKDTSNILLPVTICGVELEVDPDTGADVDIISKDDFQKIYNKRPEVADLISVPKEAIRALCGAKLGIIRVLKGASFSNKTVKNLRKDLYVIENGIHTHPLLSEKTLIDLGMVQYSVDGKFASEGRVLKTEKTNEISNQTEDSSDEKRGREEMEKIISTHKELFTGIGKLKDPQSHEPILTHIEMKPEIQSVIQPPRVVPHHLRDRT